MDHNVEDEAAVAVGVLDPERVTEVVRHNACGGAGEDCSDGGKVPCRRYQTGMQSEESV